MHGILNKFLSIPVSKFLVFLVPVLFLFLEYAILVFQECSRKKQRYIWLAKLILSFQTFPSKSFIFVVIYLLSVTFLPLFILYAVCLIFVQWICKKSLSSVNSLLFILTVKKIIKTLHDANPVVCLLFTC